MLIYGQENVYEFEIARFQSVAVCYIARLWSKQAR